MTYPQPSSDSYAINGYQFFRLNTLLSSPGDIYESKQSGHAFALGPDSDIANVNIAYFDDQIDGTFVNGTIIGPHRAFVGRLDARNETTYAPSSRPGRILFWSNDLYDPFFKPAGFNGLIDRIELITPRLDVIEYFQPQNSLTPRRNDKTLIFQNFRASLAGHFYLVVPTYGRSYVFVSYLNKDPINPINYGIVGVNFQITDDLPNNLHQRTTILAEAPVPVNGQVITKITEDNQGVFDALVFSVTQGGPSPLKIVMKDTPA